jgi:hypothetical protein
MDLRDFEPKASWFQRFTSGIGKITALVTALATLAATLGGLLITYPELPTHVRSMYCSIFECKSTERPTETIRTDQPAASAVPPVSPPIQTKPKSPPSVNQAKGNLTTHGLRKSDNLFAACKDVDKNYKEVVVDCPGDEKRIFPACSGEGNLFQEYPCRF